jgi:hypothetical protein
MKAGYAFLFIVLIKKSHISLPKSQFLAKLFLSISRF